jgi:predicted acyltransferase
MNKPAGQRFLALDVFRGMTVCFMIIVNTPGNYDTTFSPLLHAQWHGFTPTDLVFPSFLFAVGNAMSFVMPKWEGMATNVVVTKILKRTFIIFLLGFLMYWFPFMKHENGQLVFFPFDETRVFGVLQRIALCYGIAALMLYFLKPKTTYWLAGGGLLLYWGLLYWMAPAGVDPLSMEQNAVLHLDKWLIGEKHMYHGEGIAFDPEGLLSTLPAIANVVMGFAAGKFIREKGNTYETLAKLLLAGFALLVIAYFWNLEFPINKKLWSSPFVVHTVGLDLMIIAGIMYVIDFAGRTRWTYFFEVFGKNPLFIYLLSELLAILMWFFQASDGEPYYSWIYQNIFSHFGGYLGSLLFALAVMMTCWVVGYILDKKKIYVRV